MVGDELELQLVSTTGCSVWVPAQGRDDTE